jgi:hypothetical protein
MHGYAGDKYSSMVGEGHITIFPWNYSDIIQGIWAWISSSVQYFYGTLRTSSHANGDQINYKVYLDAGTYTITVLGIKDGNTGIMDVLIDGVSKGTVDTYGAGTNNSLFPVSGIVVTTPGIVTLSLKTTGKNASSGGYYMYYSSISIYRTV